MAISQRAYDHTSDFSIVRNFIADIFFQKPTYQLWIPSRFENSVFYDKDRSRHVRLWWDDDVLVGVVLVDPPNNITSILHNKFNHLLPKMIQWAEKTLINKSTERDLEVFAYSLKDDIKRISVLESLGYQFINESEHTQLRSNTDPLPEGSLPHGFYIKQIESNDYDQFVNAIKMVFHHDRFTHEVFTEMRTAKFFKDDLLIGVFTNNGVLVAFAQQRVDEYKIIEFEPVGTIPGYRRKGLAKALMRESFIRAEKYTPKIFYVGGAPTEEADRLYKSVGFTNMRIITRWSKKIHRD
ncbi:MAG: N-acetyltransferase [Promethearchaeota archaeon]|nr:MAG: N-acetyltransferase [Candidatus Lokiarchaeota archaeon]